MVSGSDSQSRMLFGWSVHGVLVCLAGNGVSGACDRAEASRRAPAGAVAALRGTGFLVLALAAVSVTGAKGAQFLSPSRQPTLPFAQR